MRWLLPILAQLTPPDSLPQPALTDGSIRTVLQIVFGFAGAVAVLIIVIAGFQYVLSQGDPQRTAKAKNTVIYAIVGLFVCIFSFAIVRFVIGRV